MARILWSVAVDPLPRRYTRYVMGLGRALARGDIGGLEYMSRLVLRSFDTDDQALLTLTEILSDETAKLQLDQDQEGTLIVKPDSGFLGKRIDFHQWKLNGEDPNLFPADHLILNVTQGGGTASPEQTRTLLSSRKNNATDVLEIPYAALANSVDVSYLTQNYKADIELNVLASIVQARAV